MNSPPENVQSQQKRRKNWKGLREKFQKLKPEAFESLNDKQKEEYCWEYTCTMGALGKTQALWLLNKLGGK